MTVLHATRATYHHGDLRRSLIVAAEELLAERGVDGFSLREVARRAGVSAAAPAHHFGDTSGLLTAVATLGFDELTRSLLAGRKGAGSDPRARLVGQGVGYVRFALAYPGRFRLMFRNGPRRDDPALSAAASGAFRVLDDDVRSLCGIAADRALDADTRAAVIAMWSIVHGFAHLAIDGRFEWMAGETPLERWVSRTLPAVLRKAIDGIASDAREGRKRR